MKRKLLLLCVLCIAMLLRVQTGYAQMPHSKGVTHESAPDFKKGMLLIKFNRSFESKLAGKTGNAPSFGINRLDAILKKYKTTSAKQQFAILFNHAFNEQSARNANLSYAPKTGQTITADILEQRHREFGFHLWYNIAFDSTAPIKAILADLQSLHGIVDEAELVPLIQTASVFNDSLYSTQHNLHNTGQGGGIPGKDIGIERAWDITTGDTNVVVCVNENAISLNHEDLDSSIWFGKGYNFTADTSALVVYYAHGTIVAGIIAARSNNGKGISGIAGGNGTQNSGARLMNCQIISQYNLTSAWAVAGFVYAADNGAAISNNSWGDYATFNKSQTSLADGVSYFTKYGGGAAIKGGLVMWAAGNDNSEIEFANTAMDIDGTIAVAATNNRDEKASYSNYGDWVDISAPGGDGNDIEGGLTSTSYDPATGENSYEVNQATGTSFAAPAVSGVAALVASVAPGRFTADEVMGIVLSTADNIDSLNPGYEGKLGSGRVNAYKAVSKAQQMAAQPLLDTVSHISVQRTCNGYNVSYTKNAANDDVMIAYGLSRQFDLPNGRSYNLGDSIGKTAVVVYKGPASSFSISSILQDSATHYIKLWSVSGTNYSGGTIYHTDSSYYTLRSPSAVQGADNVAISFGKACPNSNVMVVVNSLPQFGLPQGTLQAGDNVTGGGTVLYNGSAAGFTHSGLASGSYYYALYPVVGNRYGAAKYVGGYCFGVSGVTLSLKAGFETSEVPSHFAFFTPSQDGLGWQVTNNITGHTGMGAAFTKNYYNYLPNKLGEKSYLQTEALNVTGADSIVCSFAHAYRAYDTSSAAGSFYDISTINYQDTLSLLVSTDCGQTWQTAWQRGGTNLSTMQPNADFFDDGTPVMTSDWAADKVNLSPYLPAGTTRAMVAFANTNRAGRNIYLDDINVYKVVDNDAGIAGIISPAAATCSTTFSPKIVLKNFGKNTLTAATISYIIDSNSIETISWKGSLAYEKTDTLLLPAITLPPGDHSLTVFTANPNTLADGVTDNDTAVADFKVLSTQTVALHTTYKESFENPLSLPDGWQVADPQNPYTWQRVDKYAYAPYLEDFYAADDTSALEVVTIYDPVIGAVHDLYTSPFSTGNADTVLLTFSRAAFAYYDPGNTTDKLDVLLTTDCGRTYTNIYSKTGTDLATSQVPNQYEPLSAADWKSDTVDVSNAVRNVSGYRFVFRVTNGSEDNVFLDNVQVHSIMAGDILPVSLLNFSGKAIGANNALLSWRTATETSFSRFELQRSADGRSFTSISILQAKGNGAADYSYTDNNLPAGLYYYRLKMTDKDGKQTYSSLVTVLIKNRDAITVYPVPANNRIWINSSNSSLLNKEIQLTDMQGRILKAIKVSSLPQSIDVSSLASGMYLLRLPDDTTVKVMKR